MFFGILPKAEQVVLDGSHRSTTTHACGLIFHLLPEVSTRQLLKALVQQGHVTVPLFSGLYQYKQIGM